MTRLTKRDNDYLVYWRIFFLDKGCDCLRYDELLLVHKLFLAHSRLLHQCAIYRFTSLLRYLLTSQVIWSKICDAFRFVHLAPEHAAKQPFPVDPQLQPWCMSRYSAFEMTYILHGGALNSNHTLIPGNSLHRALDWWWKFCWFCFRPLHLAAESGHFETTPTCTCFCDQSAFWYTGWRQAGDTSEQGG